MANSTTAEKTQAQGELVKRIYSSFPPGSSQSFFEIPEINLKINMKNVLAIKLTYYRYQYPAVALISTEGVILYIYEFKGNLEVAAIKIPEDDGEC